jgi:hypothetical protein
MHGWCIRALYFIRLRIPFSHPKVLEAHLFLSVYRKSWISEYHNKLQLLLSLVVVLNVYNSLHGLYYSIPKLRIVLYIIARHSCRTGSSFYFILRQFSLFCNCNLTKNFNYTFQTARFFVVTPEKHVTDTIVSTKLSNSTE